MDAESYEVSPPALRRTSSRRRLLEVLHALGLDDERAHPRVPCDFPVDYRLFGSGEVFEGMVVNLSLGGLGLRTAAPLAKGLILALYFRSTARTVLAKVVYSRRSGPDDHWLSGLVFPQPLRGRILGLPNLNDV